ncbi:hypothetical protein CC86DRAFT_470250 [Ophiobolus disseminans]|uniref:Pheromone receptor n=1 Tax=Ophiobolus disseminans TaxID=1469910 RepID=A0A6A6ZN63_9PLEO|nr:hypothetical protein CC86DRAFT_470250 [Ophiobolus disseminans]
METIAPPPEFDPWVQYFTLIAPDGSNLTFNMEEINQYRMYTARVSISHGTQIGASFLLLLVLLLLTRAEKRKSAIFIVNALCLVTNGTRVTLLSCFVTSSWWHPYSQLVGDYSRVISQDAGTMVAYNTFAIVVTTLVMLSLSLQVWVVCITTVPVQRFFIMGATTLMALVAIGYKFAFVVLSNKQSLAHQSFDPYANVALVSYITQAASIWMYSCVFTYKLGHAILQRRKLKMPQFGPMQIVFIMGCQTLIIPAIFTCLHFQNAVPELGAQVLTVTCIFLPLSAIWAGVVNETIVVTRGPDGHHRLIQSEFYRSEPDSTAGSNASSSAAEKSRQMSMCTCATRCKGGESAVTSPRKSTLGDEDDDVEIRREFGFAVRGSERV